MSLFTVDLGHAVFVPEYKAALQQYPSIKDNLRDALGRIEKDPRAGDAIPGYAQAVRKMRLGVKGHFGKRGGYRMIYHVDWGRRVVTPIALYFKRDIPDLPAAEVTKRFLEVAKSIVPTALSEIKPTERPN